MLSAVSSRSEAVKAFACLAYYKASDSNLMIITFIPPAFRKTNLGMGE